MSDAATADAELAELRRQRMKEILERRSSPPTPKPRDISPTELTAASFPSFLAAHPRVLVDVWAPWCAPCRAVSPVLEALSNRLYPQVRFAKVNADQEPGWTGHWGVSGIPTLLFFEQGKLIDRIVGAHPSGVIEARLRGTFHLGDERPGEVDGE